jgi:hypothetical protein
MASIDRRVTAAMFIDGIRGGRHDDKTGPVPTSDDLTYAKVFGELTDCEIGLKIFYRMAASASAK